MWWGVPTLHLKAVYLFPSQFRYFITDPRMHAFMMIISKVNQHKGAEYTSDGNSSTFQFHRSHIRSLTGVGLSLSAKIGTDCCQFEDGPKLRHLRYDHVAPIRRSCEYTDKHLSEFEGLMKITFTKKVPLTGFLISCCRFENACKSNQLSTAFGKNYYEGWRWIRGCGYGTGVR